jgi:hypothetical protein
MKKFLLVAGAGVATVLMAACSDGPSAPTSRALTPGAGPSADLVCASGYIIAYDEYGNPYCAPDPNATTAMRPRRP